jgi:hypothetical protein
MSIEVLFKYVQLITIALIKHYLDQCCYCCHSYTFITSSKPKCFICKP